MKSLNKEFLNSSLQNQNKLNRFLMLLIQEPT
jgi:hypothetical protein